MTKVPFPIPLQDIENARNRIATHIRRTPFLAFDYLSKQRNESLFLKCEPLQKTGSFKIRGAANCILENLEQSKKMGVVTASAGNHAQGVAAVCQSLGIKATIVMPTWTPGIKVQNTARWGANIKLVGNMYDESYDHAMQLAKEHGYVYIHPFRDPLIMAGQGTVALELLEESDFKNIEAVVVSVGGGGLISGIASVLRQKRPDIKIYGVTARNAPAVYHGVKHGKPGEQPVNFTLAEGVATKRVESFMLDCISKSVDDIFSISEESIAHAISLLAEHGKMLVEGAGALPVAAVIDNLIPHKKIALILSGGNIDLPALGHVMQRGLVEQGRLVRLLITIIDRPGGLNSLTTVLAESSANIVQVFHQRATLHTPVGNTEVEIDIETRGHEHTSEIIDALLAKGFKVNRIS